MNILFQKHIHNFVNFFNDSLRAKEKLARDFIRNTKKVEQAPLLCTQFCLQRIVVRRGRQVRSTRLSGRELGGQLFLPTE